MPRNSTAMPTRRLGQEPVERALMLIALGLDPRFTYCNHELQTAWRRRISRVHPDKSGNGVTAAAINAAYLTLLQPSEESEQAMPSAS
ncbi:MAG: J domain-containing protein [Acidimicrobiales bacterium]